MAVNKVPTHREKEKSLEKTRKRFRKSLRLALMGTTILLVGCGAIKENLHQNAISNFRKEGFSCFAKAFNSLPKKPSLNKNIELGDIKVRIVGDPAKLKNDTENTIYILGKTEKKRVIFNQVSLGYKLYELLKNKNPDLFDNERGENIAEQRKEEGLKQFEEAFEEREADNSLDLSVAIEKLQISFLGEKSKFKDESAREKGANGYATRENDIFLLATEIGGKIILNVAILGHEFNHILQFNRPQVQNPDLLDYLGGIE